jgi:hypothetical protein
LCRGRSHDKAAQRYISIIASDGVFLTKAALAEFSAIDFTGAAEVSDQKVTGQWY